MTTFNIQEVVEHAESTRYEIRGVWYPARPKQPTGWDGFKLRVKGAIQVLLGKADTVEWSLRPIKQEKATTKVPKQMRMTIVVGALTTMPEGFDHTTLRVREYRSPGTVRPLFRAPAHNGLFQWIPAPGGTCFIGESHTGHGQRIEVKYDKLTNNLMYTGPKVIKVDFKVE